MLARKFILLLTAFSFVLSGTAAHAQGISLLRDAEIEKFLDDYSRPIFAAAGLSPDSIQILIVNDQSFNAFAGGRYMGMNTGTLLLSDTPNQLEGVIAHEAGHLAGGHSARTADAIANASRPMLLSLLLAAGAVAAGAPDAGFAVLGLGQTIGQANFLKYSRGQESSADQASITYLDRLGKSSRGATELWRKMRNSQIVTGFRINPYFQTHPLANARLTALQERAQTSPYFDVQDSPEEIHRLRLIQAKIRGFLDTPQDTMRFYPLTDQSEPAHYARAVAFYRDSQIDKALSELETILAESPDNPYFHELKGQILFEYGRSEEAIAPHQRALDLYPDNALLRLNLARALLGTGISGNVEQSVDVFKSALLLEPDNSFGWFELARAYGALGKESLANLATAESKYHAGAKGEANIFARRAMLGLERGTPEWRQATDIILASVPTDGQPQALPSGKTTPEPQPGDTTTGSKNPEKPDVPDPIVITPEPSSGDNQ